jgi:hypothetical protein
MGWKSIGAMEPVAWSARRKRTARVVRDVRSRLGGGESSPFERLDHVGSRPATAPGGAIVVESSPHPAAMAELADRLPFDGRIRHVRDGAFFDWRYRDPREEYRFLRYEIDGRTDGYLVISRGGAARSLAGPGRSHHVADWEGTSVEIRAELIESALAWAGFERLYAWTGNLTAKSKAVLERSGFEPARPELRARGMPCVLLKVLGPPGEQSVGGLSVVEPSHWDVRLIDSFR